jgi:nucleotide-binding universal stress UspA family protein
MFKHILVCTDGSKLSDKAVNAAIGLARDHGARLTGFHATEDYPIRTFPEDVMFAGSLTPATWKADQEKYARRILERVEAKAKKAGVACDTRFSSALRPYEAIIQAAKRARCDLIVMASHGRRGIQGIVLGSETNKVLTHSKLPVLVYR